MSLQVIPVHTRRRLEELIRFPFRLYRGDPHWVPPLLGERRRFLDPRRNPFYQHAQVALWLAYRHGTVVGSISAQVDRLHNEVHHEAAGHFGFFEVVEDYAVAQALLTTARDWLGEQGLAVMRGPLSFSRNHGCGLLLESLGGPPTIHTAYNPPYYAAFCERFGLHKAHDSYAYLLNLAQFVPYRHGDPLPRLLSLAEEVRAHTPATFRHLTRKSFAADMQRAKRVYHESFARNWDFVPMTDAEFDDLAAGLYQIFDPELAIGAEIDGEMVGAAIALPDANQLLRELGGRLFPLGWLKALWRRKYRPPTRCRLMILGVLPQYRQQGIEALLIAETLKAAALKGYHEIEFSWVLESNLAMNRMIAYWGQDYGVCRTRTYRLYELDLAGRGD